MYGQWLGRLCGRSCSLLSLADTQAQHTMHTRLHGGVKLVPLKRIRGSEGRCNDFDAEFRPLNEFNEERWVNVACAQLGDVTLPLVALVQVNDLYYVRDGHHRISVARWLGQQEIEAEVTVWHSREVGVQQANQTPVRPTTSGCNNKRRSYQIEYGKRANGCFWLCCRKGNHGSATR